MPRYWPLPPSSPRFMWMSATSSSSAGIADQLLAVVVGRVHRAEVGVDVEDVGPETGASRKERHAPRRGLQPEQEHALVELGRLDRARSGARRGSAARAGSSRATRSRRRPCCTLPAAHSSPTSGPPYDTIVRSRRRRSQDRAHERHRLAARAPAADADRHAVAQLGDDLVLCRALVGHDRLRIATSRTSRRACRRTRRAPRRRRR